MADKKISALTGAATPLAGTEVLPIVQSGSTVKVSVENLTAGRSVVVASLSSTGNLDVNGQSVFQGSTLPAYLGANIGAVNINNNSADGTVDFTQGLVFTANSNNTGAWATSGIVATGSGGFRGNLVFGTDNDGTKTNAITERMRITPAGVICINTISPVAGYILDISGSANASGNFVSGGGTTSQAALGNKTLEFYNTGSGDALIKSSDDSSSFTSIALNKTQVKLYTANTERLNIGSTGDVTVSTGNVVIGTAGKGIDFSANGGDVLSQYDEGTWTPTFTTWAVAPTVFSALFTRVGRQVTLNLLCQGGTCVAGSTIGGFPFTAGNSASSVLAHDGTANSIAFTGIVYNLDNKVSGISAATLGAGYWGMSVTYFV